MIEVACTHRARLGEGPVWDERTNRLCWIDIINGQVLQLEVVTNTLDTTSLHQTIGAIALCNDGNLLVAAEKGPGILSRQTCGFTPLTRLEKSKPGYRFNDGKCDAAGRFWLGTMAKDETPAAGAFYAMDVHGQFKKQISNCTIPNGMAWNQDNTRFYFIDTPTNTVKGYDFDLEQGSLHHSETVITIDPADGFPDGMTIDMEGMLWIAHWNGWQITRWNPANGQKLFTLQLPVARVSSCTFGGENKNDLYITTAYDRLTANQRKEQPLAGALFVWKNCGYRGLAAHRFKTPAIDAI